MICDYCNGKGTYDPFVGPRTKCPKCHGAGNLIPASEANDSDELSCLSGAYFHLTLCQRPHDGVKAGHWYIWEDSWDKPDAVWQMLTARYDGARMLAVDIRNQRSGQKRIYEDDDPSSYDTLKAIEAAQDPSRPEVCLGPELKFYLPDCSIYCFWHAYSKTQRLVASRTFILDPLTIGERFMVSSKELVMKTSNGKQRNWYTPEAVRIP